MRISIALASYNGAAYIREQLQSFCQQTRLPDELVVIDDGSTDNTVEIVREFAKTSPFPVHIEINPINLGYAGNFNHALSLTTGDLTFLSDQDDVWLPEKIATICAQANANPNIGCLMNDAWLADVNLARTGASKWQQIREAGMPDSEFVMGCCAAFTRPLLDLLLPIPTAARAHDNWLVGMADQLGLVERVNEPLQLYRRHGRNVSNFHVNRLARAGWREQLQQKLLSIIRRMQSTAGLLSELRSQELILERLSENFSAFEAHLGVIPLKSAHARVTGQVDWLRQRADFYRLPRSRRIVPVLNAWRSGRYASGGSIGALKDLMIRSI